MDGLDEMIPVREGRLGRGEFGLRDGEGDGGWEGLDVGYVYELDGLHISVEWIGWRGKALLDGTWGIREHRIVIST